MSFLILGGIGFGRLTSPGGFETRCLADYVDLPVIEGKPLLQFVGEGLDLITLSFHFHAAFCVPQTVWDDLRRLLAEHNALQLFHGNGRVLGRFVLTDLTRTTTVAAEDGTLIAFDCTLELKEYVDPQPLVTRRAQQREQAPARKKPGKRAKVATVKQAPQASAVSAEDVTPMPSHSSTIPPAANMDAVTVSSHATRQPAVAEVDNEPWSILTP